MNKSYQDYQDEVKERDDAGAERFEAEREYDTEPTIEMIQSDILRLEMLTGNN